MLLLRFLQERGRKDSRRGCLLTRQEEQGGSEAKGLQGESSKEAGGRPSPPPSAVFCCSPLNSSVVLTSVCICRLVGCHPRVSPTAFAQPQQFLSPCSSCPLTPSSPSWQLTPAPSPPGWDGMLGKACHRELALLSPLGTGASGPPPHVSPPQLPHGVLVRVHSRGGTLRVLCCPPTY